MRYLLDPDMPVLLRPDDAVQIGWDPQRAVLVRPPRGLTAPALASVLRTMRDAIGAEEVMAEASRHGPVDAEELTGLLTALVQARVARASARPATGRTAAIRVHGGGPLAELLVSSLRCSGAKISHTRQPHARVRAHTADLVVLTDALVAEPQLLRDLHDAGVAYLPVRLRDGSGLVGPLVIPGVTSCLHCADLHRSDRDAAWPTVAAQLRGTQGSADRATLMATAALALAQVDSVIKAVRGHADADPPATLSTTLEFDAAAGSITSRRWPRHPRCSC
ncbi:MAG TPA: TOMM precursor leader peptide-binding protein [Mycobacterium sp.]|nr:TOMM precursor leader peptide-binding protein [Mycobacterium sp.]